MDTIDLFAIGAGMIAVLSIFVQMGSECAARVWQRTAGTLDEVDLLEANTVPMTTGAEALLITLAALLKQLAILPLILYRAFSEQVWSLTPEARMARLAFNLRADILLAVSSMIGGYPERAALLYLDALRERISSAELDTPVSAKLTA